MCVPGRGLHILSWNVLGLSSVELDEFCRRLEIEGQWDILLLQEFCFTNEEFNNTSDGHFVFAQPPCLGQRRSAIIVHGRLAGFF